MTVVFPGYRDAVQIGEGGLGNVYRAVRESTGGVVAIKELREVGVGSPVWHRARRELEVLLRLRGHPNVIYVEEIIEGPLGPCLVMEFAPGGTVVDRLAGGALSGPELVLVGQQVCDALVSAHELGIVHRDIKPHNLLVGSFGQVKVCDFGIAALTRGADSRTQTQAMTLAYASPEELDGADEIGPPADVYSFGATFLHLATGRRPSFKDRTDASIGAQLQGLDTDPALVSLSGAIRRCLLHEPSHRPTMVELSKMFEQAGTALGDRRLQRLVVARPDVGGSPDPAPAAPTPTRVKGLPRTDPTVAARPVDQSVHVSDEDAGRAVIATPDRTVLRSSVAPSPDPVGTGLGASLSPEAAALPAHRGRRMAWLLVGAAVTVAVGALIAGLATSGKSDDRAQVTIPTTEIPTTGPGTTVTAWVEPAMLQILSGHGGGVRSVAYSFNGTQIVTGSGDRTAIVWDAASGDRLFTLAGHAGYVSSVAYSPDGGRIVTGSGVGTAIVWDAASGDRLFTLAGHAGYVSSVAYSPDGSRIVTGNGDRTAIVWDAASGSQLTTLAGHAGGVSSVAYSPDGSRIVTGSEDRTAIVWDAASGSQLTTLAGHADYVSSVAYSPDGSRIVTGSWDDTAIVWDAASGSQLTTLAGQVGGVYSVAYSPDGRRIVITGFGATVWGSAFGDYLGPLLAPAEYVLYAAAFSPDGSRIVTGSGDGTAIVWDAKVATL